MATLTLGNVKPAGYVHAGLNVLYCKVSLSVTLSVGDVHIIGRLPHGAIPIEAIFYAGADSPATFIGKFGISASQEAFFTSDSWADVTTCIRSTPRLGTIRRVSASDEQVGRWENVTMVATAGCSVGHVCDLVVYYSVGLMDNL